MSFNNIFYGKLISFSCWQHVCSGIASKLVCKYASEYIVCKNASFCLCSCLFYCKNLTTIEKYLKAYTKAAGCCCFWYKMRNQFLSILIFSPLLNSCFAKLLRSVSPLQCYYTWNFLLFICCKNWKFLPPPKSANTFLRGQKNLAKMILFVVTHKYLCVPCVCTFSSIQPERTLETEKAYTYFLWCALC